MLRSQEEAAIAEAIAQGCLPATLRELYLEDNPFSPTSRAALRRACHTCGIALSAYSEIENESLYQEMQEVTVVHQLAGEGDG